MGKETLNSQIAFWEMVATDNSNEREARRARALLSFLYYCKKNDDEQREDFEGHV